MVKGITLLEFQYFYKKVYVIYTDLSTFVVG